VRQLGARNRVQSRVLVIDRGRHQKGARHRAHLRSPDAAGDHHHFGLDSPPLGQDRLHFASPGLLDPGHARLGQHPNPKLLCDLGQGEGRRMRIEVPVSRDPDGAKQ